MKQKQKPTYQSYPEPVRSRGGCKVSWNYYANRLDAMLCAKAAEHNAKIQEERGYDFGYCSPGNIRLCADGTYEVTLP